MNTESRVFISRAVGILRGHLSVIDANQALITEADAAAAQLDNRRVNIVASGRGTADLLALMPEIERINAHITKLGARRQELCQVLNDDLSPIYPEAQALLRRTYERDLAAAIVRIRPSVGSDQDAEREAKKTFECQTMRQALTSIGAGPWDRAESHARTIVQHFEAALLEANSSEPTTHTTSAE